MASNILVKQMNKKHQQAAGGNSKLKNGFRKRKLPLQKASKNVSAIEM